MVLRAAWVVLGGGGQVQVGDVRQVAAALGGVGAADHGVRGGD